jgi:hypothetical protein
VQVCSKAEAIYDSPESVLDRMKVCPEELVSCIRRFSGSSHFQLEYAASLPSGVLACSTALGYVSSPRANPTEAEFRSRHHHSAVRGDRLQ